MDAGRDVFGGAKLILFIGAQLVLLRRDDCPGIPWPNRLDLPGGGREGGETAETCVLRELGEELGLQLGTKDLVWRSQLGQGVFFAAHLPAGHETQIVFGSEGQGWCLLAPGAFVRHPDAIPHHAQIVQRYLDQEAC